MKHSTVKDKPIKDLLSNINTSLIQCMLDCRYAGNSGRIPTADYLSTKPPTLHEDALAAFNMECTNGITDITYELGTTLPDTSMWLQVLAGPQLGCALNLTYNHSRHLIHRQSSLSPSCSSCQAKSCCRVRWLKETLVWR
jgi:fatty acid synthase subunit beta